MRKLSIVVLVALVAGILAHRIVIHSTDTLPEHGADIAWLESEFNLDQAQFSAIKKLHSDYAAVCSRHCANIIDARADMKELEAAGADKSEITTALDRIHKLESICNNATREHLHKVAQLMPAEEGTRFLALVEPHLASAPHDGVRFPSSR